MDANFKPIVSIPPNIGSNVHPILFPTRWWIDMRIKTQINFTSFTIIQHINIRQSFTGINHYIFNAVGNNHSGSVIRLKFIPAIPFGQDAIVIALCFFKPSVWYMKIVDRIFFRSYLQINRHLHSTFTFEFNFILVSIQSFLYSSNFVVNVFCSFHPLVKKPIQINFGKMDN